MDQNANILDAAKFSIFTLCHPTMASKLLNLFGAIVSYCAIAFKILCSILLQLVRGSLTVTRRAIRHIGVELTSRSLTLA
jgi:hypothetical protein